MNPSNFKKWIKSLFKRKFTSGSGTSTIPSNVSVVEIRTVGGGGGQQVRIELKRKATTDDTL